MNFQLHNLHFCLIIQTIYKYFETYKYILCYNLITNLQNKYYLRFTFYVKSSPFNTRRKIGWKIFSHNLEMNVKIHTDFNPAVTRELVSTLKVSCSWMLNTPSLCILILRATLDITGHFSTQPSNSWQIDCLVLFKLTARTEEGELYIESFEMKTEVLNPGNS